VPNGDPAQHIADIVSTPLEQLLIALGAGIGRSQAELDRHTIETQAQIDQHPVLSQYGLEATWYQIPSTELELKIAISMDQPPPETRPVGLAPAGGEPLALGVPEFLKSIPRLWAQPVNARLSNQFGFRVDAASTVRLSIQAVPPPAAATVARPQATEEQVLAKVRDLLLPKDDLSKPPSGRVSVNFNPGAAAWYVVQSEESEGTVQLRVLVKVDDATLAVIGHEERT
jgi:hypothetical protein